MTDIIRGRTSTGETKTIRTNTNGELLTQLKVVTAGGVVLPVKGVDDGSGLGKIAIAIE